MYLYTSGNDPLDTDIIKPAAGAANALLSMRSNFCQKVSKRKKEEEEVLVSGRVSIYLPSFYSSRGVPF